MVQSHIKSLLYAYDCVIIPDFGGLITHYAPAKIHPVKHTFTPPSKRIAFNEQLKVNDGLLISTLAQQQRWPMSQAQQAVAEFVQELKEQLLSQHRFELKDVGVFRYNAERKVVFENLDSDNFLEHAFGLPELVAKPIAGKDTLVLRGKYQDQPAHQHLESKKAPSRFRKLYRVGASLIIGGISVAGIYLLSLQQEVALGSLNPLALFSTSENAAPVASPSEQVVETDAFEQAQLTEQYKSALPIEPSIEAELAMEDSVLAKFPKNSPETQMASVASAEVVVLEKENLATAPKSVEVAAPATPVKAEEKAVRPAAKKEEAVANATTIKRKTGRFYVIMGVFSLDGYAATNQKRLMKKGYDAKIVTPAHDTKRQRVSVADYATEAEALAALPALRDKISNELWVFNY
ncbi:SPOR domain-containing protein [Rufibacter immobilis]|uniref:SPOR domain-containing protein n=1 Tax=Rufibacter immobilis TaxID=1348778 RepID=A0A3M9MQ99_9BACT|nr:SPOR domain-containing protein [Rufibacter immobilis]RNI27696.1 SPOR domain-containing protein [Rufibacter immobilis]